MGLKPSEGTTFVFVSIENTVINMFSGKTVMTFYVPFAQQWFSSWSSAMKAIFAQFVMNIDVSPAVLWMLCWRVL